MKSTPSEFNSSNIPRYSIAQIMELLDLEEPAVRKMIRKAGISIETRKSDPGERIPYEDFRKLWLSVANRYEGKLLAKMLIEEHENWYSKLIRKGR